MASRLKSIRGRGMTEAIAIAATALAPIAPWLNDDVAPNGLPVRDNFAAWFDGSALLNGDGQPYVVYRGDREPVDTFEREDRREYGLFFAIEKERADYYGPSQAFVLRASKVLDLRNAYGHWFKGGPVAQIIETLFEDHLEGNHCQESGEPLTLADAITAIEEGYLWRMDGTGGWTMNAWRDLQRIVHAEGYDALIVHDDGEGAGKGLDVIVFEPDQVKLAYGNAGVFSTDSLSVSDAGDVGLQPRERLRA